MSGDQQAKASVPNTNWLKKDDEQLRVQVLSLFTAVSDPYELGTELLARVDLAYKWVKGE